MSPSLLILSSGEVDAAVKSFAPDELQTIMAVVFNRLSSNTGMASPQRISIKTSNHTSLFMPSRVADLGTAIKVVSVPSSPTDSRGLPASTLVIDESTGGVKALINARSLTALRTAAGSVLATRLIGPKDPLILLAFGAGKQIEAHVELHLRVFPSIIACVLANRSLNARVHSLCALLRARHVNVKFAPITLNEGMELRKWVWSANIICTATSATAPLFPSAWVQNGTHINLIGSYTPGMREVDADLVRRASLVLVDSREACLAEAGELIDAGVGKDGMVEIGDIVRVTDDNQTQRIDQEAEKLRKGGVTIFKSVGLGLQDVAIAAAVVERAESMGIGTKIGSYDI